MGEVRRQLGGGFLEDIVIDWQSAADHDTYQRYPYLTQT